MRGSVAHGAYWCTEQQSSTVWPLMTLVREEMPAGMHSTHIWAAVH